MTLCGSLTRAGKAKVLRGPKHAFLAALAVLAIVASPAVGAASSNQQNGNGSGRRSGKLDSELTRRSQDAPSSTSQVIVTVYGGDLPSEFRAYWRGVRLGILNAYVLEVPNGVLKALAAHPNVARVDDDRPVYAHNYLTGVTVGATTVRQTLGFTGAGVTVAVIDSGVASWHDDLTIQNTQNSQGNVFYPYGNQRVVQFVDFVNGQTLPYDDNGHGTHVTGTIAGHGFDSNGQRAGIAPDASIVSLKVLDATGVGTTSRVISALDWIAANARHDNIRVVNLSVGAPVNESYWTDPLTLAAKALTDRGIVVVAAAGNLGKNSAGQSQWGGITAPGNAPWVLTVGASSTMGTPTRADDTLAGFSSHGPTYIDFLAKPDLVAPGTGTVSLAVPGSTLYVTKPQMLVQGLLQPGSTPYISLSGTSMAAPVVSGTVALMLQANPSLTPNFVKAILQYTAQPYPGYKPLEQGAGFLNTLGAVQLAQFYAHAYRGQTFTPPPTWGQQVVWGNHRLSGGTLQLWSSAWQTTTVWGTSLSAVDNVVWGNSLNDNVVWGTACGGADCSNILWGTYDALDNIVWGTASLGDNIVWGTVGIDNVVWGTAALDNIVWGMGALDNIVWGMGAFDNIVWGMSAVNDVMWVDAPVTKPAATGAATAGR